jgi:hypothetical protein
MGEPNIRRGTLSPVTLQRLGEMLRGEYQLPATLPSGAYDLLIRLDRRDGPSTSDEPGLVHASKGDDYRGQAVETMQLARQASSSAVKARLVNLAEAWIALAERARKVSRQFRP